MSSDTPSKDAIGWFPIGVIWCHFIGARWHWVSFSTYSIASFPLGSSSSSLTCKGKILADCPHQVVSSNVKTQGVFWPSSTLWCLTMYLVYSNPWWPSFFGLYVSTIIVQCHFFFLSLNLLSWTPFPSMEASSLALHLLIIVMNVAVTHLLQSLIMLYHYVSSQWLKTFSGFSSFLYLAHALTFLGFSITI